MKNLIIMLTLCATLNNLTGQNSFGIISYPHPDAWLSSGVVTQSTTGFLMAGFEPSRNTYNFTLDKTTPTGQVSSPPGSFQNGYQILSAQPTCMSFPGNVVHCVGVTAIECIGTGSISYVAAVGLNFGCMFIKFDSGGNITQNKLFYFPTTPTVITKPVITQSAIAPNRFYITGSYDGNMYVMAVDTAGTVNRQVSYSSSAFLDPRAIIESPYGNNDITIVGVSLTNTSTLQDGFFYQIANNIPSPTLIVFDTYDITAGGNTNNGFTSIVTATAVGGYASGFLVGGFSEASTTPGFKGQAWMIKTDPAGAVLWNTLIEGQTDAQAGKIHAVIERESTNYSMFECYGAATTNSGITVYKLDQDGIPYSVSMALPDEFVFNTGSNSHTFPVAMSFKNNSANANEGLHVYGNLEATGPGDYYLVQSYFNGYDGCNTPVDLVNYDQSNTPTVTNVGYTNPTTLTPCQAFTITTSTLTSVSAICGPTSSVSGGSNLKALNISDNSDEHTQVMVVPNPSSGKSALHYNLQNKAKVNLSISNNLGQIVCTLIDEENMGVGEHAVTIDPEKLQLPVGVYFIRLEVDGEARSTKFIYTKN